MKQRYLLLLLIAIVYIAGNLTLDRWKTTLYYGDSNNYYLHVVSFFVNQDVGNYDKSIGSLLEVRPDATDARKDKFGIRLTEKGRYYIKYTLGVGVMETPFFLIAHAYAKMSDKYEANGWTRPYFLAVGFAVICYVLIGFNLLIKVLNSYFPKRVTALTVLAIAFATNLFFQSTYLTMAHGFLFFDYCVLIYLTIHFYKSPGIWRALGIGAMVGLIALTRVPEVISALVPLLWGVISWQSLKDRIQFFVKNYSYLLLASIGFFAVFSIQIAYWYYVSGHFFFNPYEGEGFNFLRPNIHKGWLHYANGWLIYTPIMAFSLLGWLFLRKYHPGSQLAIFAFVGLHSFIHYSYYAWTYFPGLGQRPMVETYPLLSFGLAACFLFFTEKKWLSWLPIVLLVFFTWLNFFQTWQMKKGVIWTERANKAFYWETFGTLKSTINSLRAYDTKRFQPDSSQLEMVEIIVEENFEDSTQYSVNREFVHSGQFSFYEVKEYSNLVEGTLGDIAPCDWLGLSIYAYMKGVDRPWNRDLCEILILEIYDEKGQKQNGSSIPISAYIGNTDHSIWSTGEIDRWGEASFFLEVPKKAKPSWTYKAYIFNPHGQKLYLDDLQLKWYKG